MHVLKIAALFALFICVLSEIDVQALGGRYCKETCNKDKWQMCVENNFPETHNICQKCVANITGEYSTRKENDIFLCKIATEKQAATIVNCYYKGMVETYKKEDVDKVLEDCTNKCEGKP